MFLAFCCHSSYNTLPFSNSYVHCWLNEMDDISVKVNFNKPFRLHIWNYIFKYVCGVKVLLF